MKTAQYGKLPLPNFFVIGAPKSGTTALWHALSQHPDIHFSPIKEPCFFLSDGRVPENTGHGWDFIRRVGVWRSGDYVKLFGESGLSRIIGEASTPYLSSPKAAMRIHDRLPDSRIVLVLRQPADRAYSHFNFARQMHLEPESSFRVALADQVNRQSNGWFPNLLHEWSGHYHAHLQPWLKLFPRERIQVFLYDDWQHQPRQMLTALFRFLEVNDRFQPNLERRNVTHLPRFKWLQHIAVDNRWCGLPVPESTRGVLKSVHDLVRKADTHFNRVVPRSLDPNLRAELTRGYRDDILKLEQLLDRDLSFWLAGT